MRRTTWLWLALAACGGGGTDTLRASAEHTGSTQSTDCEGPARLEISVEGAADEVAVTHPGGDVEVLEDDGGIYEVSGEPGRYEVTVSACGGAQVVTSTVDVPASNRCDDVYEVEGHRVTLDPCR